MMSLERVPCPLCGNSESFEDVRVPQPDLHIHKYGAMYPGKRSEWQICGRCGFVHQNPRPTAAALNAFYLQSSYHEPLQPSVPEHLAFSRWYYSEKIDYCLRNAALPAGRVFDIGCGLGGVLKLYQERGWAPFGVEPDAHQASYAREQFGLTDVATGILDSTLRLPQPVDLVVSNHAFEHFADLDEVMRGVCNILRPGGYMFVVVPTYMSNKSSLSRRWMNSAHYSLFTHRTLATLLARYGFEEVAHTYRGWKKEHDDLWFLARRTDAKLDPARLYDDPRKVSRYLRVINPLRSFVFYPLYSHWDVRVRLYNQLRTALGLLIRSPGEFVQKLSTRIGGVRG
jgi:SAM-dependent methyltransferase